MANAEYIGDGVYVSSDGYQLWLHTGSHTTAPVVALEQSVFTSLVEYGNKFFNIIPKDTTNGTD